MHTCFPHYPAGVITAPYRNGLWLREQVEGVNVVRTAVYPAANRGFTRRLLDHASFAASALATAPFSPPADVVVVESPPLFLAAAGIAYGALKRAAVVLNVADRWPASAVELGALRDGRAIALASAMERWCYRRATLIAAPTAGIVDAVGSLPAARGRVVRTLPVVDLRRFADVPPDRGEAAGGPLRVLYAGTLGLAQGLETLVEASRLAGRDVVRTVLAGDGADAAHLRSLIGARRVENVTMVGAVASDRVAGLYAECDVAAVSLRDREVLAGALPTKLLEAMAAGRAVALSARGEAARLTSHARAGVVVRPEDPAALAEAFGRLHADPAQRAQLGARGRRYAGDHFGREHSVGEWDRLLTEAVRLTAS